MLHVGRESNRIDVVVDVYKEKSIKSAERLNRGSLEGMIFSHIKPAHKIKNWRRLLAFSKSKTELTHFLADSWKDKKRREALGNKIMFVTCGEQCIRLTQDSYEEVSVLQTNQEEADTRLLLHARRAAEQYSTLIGVTDDTDVFVISLGLRSDIRSMLFIRRGTKTHTRLVDITKLATVLGREVCSSLQGLHAWTGCDTVSSLYGQGKVMALKIILQNQKYREEFASLGSQWQVSKNDFNTIQEFTCQLHCRNTKVVEVNELKYQIFICRKGDIQSGQLPPCEDTLRQHTNRANYQAGIWRRSLENFPLIPNPADGHGWINSDNGNLNIRWMIIPPAPDAVLCLMLCKCKKLVNPQTAPAL